MSNRTKKKTRRKKTSKQLKSKENLIDFDTWFWFKEKDKKVRPEQKKEIRVFFEQKGLKDKEEKTRYEEILKLY